jgi:hypothetical protein
MEEYTNIANEEDRYKCTEVKSFKPFFEEPVNGFQNMLMIKSDRPDNSLFPLQGLVLN